MVTDLEIWKDIEGYEGYYQISNHGRVKSLDRLINYWRGGKSLRKELILKVTPNENGYLSVSLVAKDGKRKTHKIHKLSMLAFIGPRPIIVGKPADIDHIDKDPSNNAITNLRYLSHRENCSRHTGTTGIGVLNRNGRFSARIFINGKAKSLGTFATEPEATDAYLVALQEVMDAY